MLQYRDYQADLDQRIHQAWQSGHKNVLAVSPPGTGKTVLFAGILSQHQGPLSVAIAHREELIGQMCVTLAKHGVPHRVAVSKAAVKRLALRESREAGRCLLKDGAKCIVASVDTLAAAPRNRPELVAELARASLWVIDEAHHVIEGNKWGRVVGMMPGARGLGVTATPGRTNGTGLGAHADGVFHNMIEGMAPREAIEQGWLTDYDLAVPPHQVVMGAVAPSSATGDWSARQIAAAVSKAGIVGDVVDTYLRLARGRLAICYAPTVEIGKQTAARFNAAGVPAEIVSAKTKDTLRTAINRRFAKRELLMLVNVDLFGEGYDLPAIEVVIMMRPTASLTLYIQQGMRAMRPDVDGLLDPHSAGVRLQQIADSRKPKALIIDHVGNVVRHKGPPDTPRIWTLDARPGLGSRGPQEVSPIRSCLNPECMQVFERVLTACPYCGKEVEYAERSEPEQVEGDLVLLDKAVLDALRAQAADAMRSPAEVKQELIAKHCPAVGLGANINRHKRRKEAIEALRATMDWWAGMQVAKGRTTREAQKLFYRQFGVDVLSALSKSAGAAEELTVRVSKNLTEQRS